MGPISKSLKEMKINKYIIVEREHWEGQACYKVRIELRVEIRPQLKLRPFPAPAGKMLWSFPPSPSGESFYMPDGERKRAYFQPTEGAPSSLWWLSHYCPAEFGDGSFETLTRELLEQHVDPRSLLFWNFIWTKPDLEGDTREEGAKR
jgi:hypothetical protein